MVLECFRHQLQEGVEHATYTNIPLTCLTFGILTWLTWRPDSTPPARVTTLWEKIILEKLIFPGMVFLKSEMPQALQGLENPVVIWHSDFHAHG